MAFFFVVVKKAPPLPPFSTHPNQNNKSVYIRVIFKTIMGQSLYESSHMKVSLICVKMNLSAEHISIWMVLHKDSFRNWGNWGKKTDLLAKFLFMSLCVVKARTIILLPVPCLVDVFSWMLSWRLKEYYSCLKNSLKNNLICNDLLKIACTPPKNWTSL